jgi:beta-lactamase regulating signal transducer with metallopeptidase domain
MNAEFAAVCDRILGALLNGMGEGLLLVLLLIGLFKAFRRINAATRHALELTTLLLVALLPFGHLLLDSTDGPNGADPLPRVSAPAGALAPLPSPPASAEDKTLTTRIHEEPVSIPWNLSLPPHTSEVLLGLWVLVSSIRVLFLVAQLLALRRLKRDGLNASEPVRELFSKLCVELKVSRAPQLRVADQISAPMAVGFKEPAVLLPQDISTSATAPRLEQILRHELAHVVRRDDWANLFQQTIRALFFFHPGVIWASRRMTVDREIACDDHVLSAIADRKAYALSLTEFASSRKQQPDVIAAPAAWSNQSQLKQRINMILDTKRNSSPRIARGKTSLFALAAILLAALAFQAGPRLAFAQTAAVEAPPAEPAVAATPATPAAPGPVEVSVSVVPEAVPVPRPRPRIAIGSTKPIPPTAALTLNALPPGGPSGGVLWAAAPPPEDGDDSAPRRKNRVRAEAGDDVEHRLDRLEKMVESMKRDTEKRNFAFQFQDKFRPDMDFKFNADQFAKIGKDAAEQAQRAVEKARKDVELRGDPGVKGADDLKVARKSLEEQRQALEKQMRALEKQIQKLERAQQKIEEERNRNENRDENPRDRDQKRRERDEDDSTAKEKDAPKP